MVSTLVRLCQTIPGFINDIEVAPVFVCSSLAPHSWRGRAGRHKPKLMSSLAWDVLFTLFRQGRI
jgi:hypothetical protein